MKHSSLRRRRVFRRTTGLAVLTAMTYSQASAQMDAQFWNRYPFYNPAATGLLYKHDAVAGAGIGVYEKNIIQQDYYAGYQARVKPLHGALGFNYVRSQFGNKNYTFTNEQIKLNYSYHIQLGEESKLAIGASAGITRFYSSEAIFGDTIIENSRVHGLNASLGVAYQHKSLVVGASLNNVTGVYSSANGMHPVSNASLSVFADYTYKINDKISLKPSIMLRSFGGSVSFNGALRAEFNDQWWVGISKSPNRMGLSAGYNFNKNFGIGYSFEVNQHFAKQNNFYHSHSLNLRFHL